MLNRTSDSHCTPHVRYSIKQAQTCRILHQTYILHPILHPELPANTEDLGHWCRKCRRFSKNFFYGGEYAYAPTYCRQRSPTQNETGTSAGDLCAKTLKTHRGRTKFRVVFVDYPERGGRRRSQTMFNRILFLRNDFRGVGAHDAADVP